MQSARARNNNIDGKDGSDGLAPLQFRSLIGCIYKVCQACIMSMTGKRFA